VLGVAVVVVPEVVLGIVLATVPAIALDVVSESASVIAVEVEFEFALRVALGIELWESPQVGAPPVLVGDTYSKTRVSLMGTEWVPLFVLCFRLEEVALGLDWRCYGPKRGNEKGSWSRLPPPLGVETVTVVLVGNG
jgi:hypothetical protein